jgi:hypothetical protein
MAYSEFQWTDAVVEHLAEHGVSQEDFAEVVSSPERRGESRSTSRPCCWGETSDGRYLLCEYEYLDELSIIPITAYDLFARAPQRGSRESRYWPMRAHVSSDATMMTRERSGNLTAGSSGRTKPFSTTPRTATG